MHSSPLQEFILSQCVHDRGDDVLLQLSFALDDELHPSPLRHLLHFPSLRSLFIQQADSTGDYYSDAESLRLQQLTEMHMTAIRDVLAADSCRVQSLTLARWGYSSWMKLFALSVRVNTSLTSLDLSYSSDLDDSSLQLLSGAFPRLMRIDLSFARRNVHTESSNTPTAVEQSVNNSFVCNDAEVDPPICPYSPACVIRVVGELRELRSLRVLCHSAADAARLTSGDFIQRCSERNPSCRIVSSRWQ